MLYIFGYTQNIIKILLLILFPFIFIPLFDTKIAIFNFFFFALNGASITLISVTAVRKKGRKFKTYSLKGIT